MDILPTGQKNPYSGGGPYVSLLRQAYAKAYPNLPIPTESLEQSLRTGSRPFIDAEGKIYFLTENKEQTASLMATERESARRAKRPVQPFTPSYSYKTASGERFSGTFMGEGGYGGFGRFATDEQGNRASKYSPQIMARRAAKGKDPYAAESTGILEPAGKGLGPVLPRSQRERQLAGVGATPSISMAMAGDPFSFTRFGQMTGMAPQPTASFISESPSLFDRNQFGSMTGFGGVPMFPFSNY